MNRRGRLALWFLAVLVGAPAALLLVRSVLLFRPATPVVLVLPEGRRVLAMPVPADPRGGDRGGFRAIRSDGVVETFDPASIASRAEAPEAWAIRTADGGLRLGWIEGLVVPEGDTLRGEDRLERFAGMRDELERDREARLAELADARGSDAAPSARSRWRLFARMEGRTGLLLRDAAGGIGFLRLSEVRQVERAPASPLGMVVHWGGRILGAFADRSDQWGGGGIRQAGLSTLALILLAGSVGGTLALFAALLLSERLRPGRRARVVRRTSGWLAAVPGVVWGAVGCGLLVPVLGGGVDALLGLRDRWSHGGLLWSALTLGILAAPISLRRALDVLDTVPRQWRRVARSCGATRLQVLWMVVLPASWRGLLGAWLSAFARAAGETAPLLLVGAIHSDGGILAPVGGAGLSLSGGFLHLGAMAYDPVWSELETVGGYPTAHLALLLLTVLCIGFELLAGGFLGRGRRPAGEEPGL